MRSSIVSAALFAAAVGAIQINTPTKNEVVDLTSESFTVTWDTVSSDPSSAALYLVNEASGNAEYSKEIATVDLSSGSYTVDAISGLTAESGYQFNLVSVSSGSSGILAQSQQFNVSDSGSSSSSSSSSESTTSTSSSSSSSTGTATGATTTSGSSTSTGTASAAGSTFTTSTSSASATKTTSTATKSSSTANASSTASTTTSNAANKMVGGSMMALAVGAAVALLA